MLLPANFKSTIASHFYDKTISLLGKNVVSEDGWVDEKATIVTGTFKGNVHFDKLAEAQSELGITEQINIIVTCDADIQKGQLFEYSGVKYRATAVIPADSHKKVAGVLWV